MKYKVSFFIVLLSFICANRLHAQTLSLSQIEQQITKLNASFDSTYYFAFDVNFNYSTFDSSNTVLNSSARIGHYVVKGNCFYYNLGDVEFMQNDSLAFTIYNTEKMIILSKASAIRASNTFMLNSTVSNIIDQYATYYDITGISDSVSPTSTISFVARDSADLPYKKIAFTYDTLYNRMSSIEFNNEELQETQNNSDSLHTSQTMLINKRMLVSFSNYQPVDIDKSIFQNEKFVYYNSIEKKYQVVKKYREYRLYTSQVKEGY